MGSHKKGAGATNTYSFIQHHRTITPVSVLSTIAEVGIQSSNPQTSTSNPLAVVGGFHSILNGIDTLVLTAGGSQFPSDWLIEQQQVWKEYQQQYDYSSHQYLEVEVAGYWFQLYPVGELPYKYKLYNKQIGMIKVWNCDRWSSGVNGKQHIFLDLRASFIHSFSPAGLKIWIEDFYSIFFKEMNGVDIQVSRGDLFVDIMCDRMLITEEVEASISRCKTTNRFYENGVDFTEEEEELLSRVCNKGEQKLNQSVLSQFTPEFFNKIITLHQTQKSIGANRIVGNTNRLETAYWGNHKGGMVWGKIYDKTLSARKNNDTDIEDLWVANGWDRNKVVVRVEFSMRRGFIKELNEGKFVSLSGFIEGMNIIWDYFSTKWLRLVEAKKRNNIQLSVNTPFWDCVSNSFMETAVKVIRNKSFRGKINQLFKQATGCLTSMISYGMSGENDRMYMKCVIQAVDKVMNEAYEDSSILHRRRLLGLN
jgi:hypothetical protein